MKFSYMLAPMEDFTSCSFRSICHKYGADMTFTELARVQSLAKNNKSTWSRIITKDDTPTTIQLLGHKEMFFKKFLKMFKPTGGFLGFNLNLGCPNPSVINLGQGCAMVRRIAKTRSIVNIFKDNNYPISIKMRLGMNKKDKQNKVYIHLLEEVDADFFIIHSRYGIQDYSEPADFSIFEECVKTGKSIIANGDIKDKSQVEFLKTVGMKGVMIGRAAIINPSIFNELKGIESPDKKIILNEYLGLFNSYNEPFKYKKNVLKHFGKKLH